MLVTFSPHSPALRFSFAGHSNAELWRYRTCLPWLHLSSPLERRICPKVQKKRDGRLCRVSEMSFVTGARDYCCSFREVENEKKDAVPSFIYSFLLPESGLKLLWYVTRIRPLLSRSEISSVWAHISSPSVISIISTNLGRCRKIFDTLMKR